MRVIAQCKSSPVAPKTFQTIGDSIKINWNRSIGYQYRVSFFNVAVDLYEPPLKILIGIFAREIIFFIYGMIYLMQVIPSISKTLCGSLHQL